MGQVTGYLRKDRATYGEKLVLEKLRSGLPDDFYVYVECPFQNGHLHAFPDFIVVCNFGAIVLEVKDWVHVLEADKYSVTIQRRDGEISCERSPVLDARENALLLVRKLQTVPALLKKRRRLDLPWGYAAVLTNLPVSTIVQLRAVWGQRYVLRIEDLNPPLVTKRLRATLPYRRCLRRHEIRLIRDSINPTISIASANRANIKDVNRSSARPENRPKTQTVPSQLGAA